MLIKVNTNHKKYIFTYIPTHIDIHICMYLYICNHIYIYIYIYYILYVCMYIQKYIHIWAFPFIFLLPKKNSNNVNHKNYNSHKWEKTKATLQYAYVTSWPIFLTLMCSSCQVLLAAVMKSGNRKYPCLSFDQYMDWWELAIPDLTRMSLIKSYWIL